MKPHKKTMKKQAKCFAMLLFVMHTLNIGSTFASERYIRGYKLTQQTTELKVLLTSRPDLKAADQNSLTRPLPEETLA